MRAVTLLLAVCLLHWTRACEPDQLHNGCRLLGSVCSCGYGCKNEYVYKSRAACLNALRERSSNACYRMPCLRGICIQTAMDPGFSCKCENTGFYGQRCERACPTIPMRGLVFPHECIVI
ncbi:cubilin-like [Plodia interpunctella]|uniref:cubilin-like n=1 Tax=Plodia interpunctella TaxID=58824 RepID=UPI0023679C1A|nr:cubilin-like [Plodia interpunctella]